MSKLGFYAIILSLVSLLLIGCKQDDLDFEKFSDRVELERQIAIPLIYGQVTVDDILEQFETTLLLIDGDTVEVIFGVDSISFVEDQDLVFGDSISIRDSANFENQEFNIETAKIHVKLKNYFPIGLSCEILLYDAITSSVLDTIKLNPENGFLIKPSPVNSNGEVLINEVVEYNEEINLEEQTLENLLHVATHFIFNVEMEITDPESVNSVKIPSTSTLDFHIGLEASGSYISN